MGALWRLAKTRRAAGLLFFSLSSLAAALPAHAGVDRFWAQITPSSALPLSRSEIGGIYDPVRDRLVFFGGLRDDALDETWSYDFATAVWTRLFGAAVPPPRTNHAAIHDPARDRMVIFGGEFDEDLTYQDTWAFDLAANTWSEIATVGSFPKTGMVSGYDAGRDRLWVALGYAVNDFDTTVGYLDFASGLWTVVPNVGAVPERRIGAVGAIDAARDRLVLYGGNDREDYYEDTFTFDLETFEWREYPEAEIVPSRRAFGRALLDATRNRLLIFGGNREGDFYNELWAFTLDNERWTELVVDDDPSPSTRNTSLFVHDTTRDRFIVFAGQKRGERRNDVWEFVDRAGETGSGTLRVNGNLAPFTLTLDSGDRIDLDIQGRLDGSGARYVLFADARGTGTPVVLPGGIPFCFDPRTSSPTFAPGTVIVCDTVGVSLSSGPFAGLPPPLRTNCPLAPPAPDFARVVEDGVINLPSGRSLTLQALVRDPARRRGFGSTPALRVSVR